MNYFGRKPIQKLTCRECGLQITSNNLSNHAQTHGKEVDQIDWRLVVTKANNTGEVDHLPPNQDFLVWRGMKFFFYAMIFYCVISFGVIVNEKTQLGEITTNFLAYHFKTEKQYIDFVSKQLEAEFQDVAQVLREKLQKVHPDCTFSDPLLQQWSRNSILHNLKEKDAKQVSNVFWKALKALRSFTESDESKNSSCKSCSCSQMEVKLITTMEEKFKDHVPYTKFHLEEKKATFEQDYDDYTQARNKFKLRQRCNQFIFNQNIEQEEKEQKDDLFCQEATQDWLLVWKLDNPHRKVEEAPKLNHPRCQNYQPKQQNQGIIHPPAPSQGQSSPPAPSQGQSPAPAQNSGPGSQNKSPTEANSNSRRQELIDRYQLNENNRPQVKLNIQAPSSAGKFSNFFIIALECYEVCAIWENIMRSSDFCACQIGPPKNLGHF